MFLRKRGEKKKREMERCGFTQSKSLRGLLSKVPDMPWPLFFISHRSSLWVSRCTTAWPMWAKWSPSDICLSHMCGQFEMNRMAKVNEVKSFTLWWSIKIRSHNETSFAYVWFHSFYYVIMKEKRLRQTGICALAWNESRIVRGIPSRATHAFLRVFAAGRRRI